MQTSETIGQRLLRGMRELLTIVRGETPAPTAHDAPSAECPACPTFHVPPVPPPTCPLCVPHPREGFREVYPPTAHDAPSAECPACPTFYEPPVPPPTRSSCVTHPCPGTREVYPLTEVRCTTPEPVCIVRLYGRDFAVYFGDLGGPDENGGYCSCFVENFNKGDNHAGKMIVNYRGNAGEHAIDACLLGYFRTRWTDDEINDLSDDLRRSLTQIGEAWKEHGVDDQ